MTSLPFRDIRKENFLACFIPPGAYCPTPSCRYQAVGGGAPRGDLEPPRPPENPSLCPPEGETQVDVLVRDLEVLQRILPPALDLDLPMVIRIEERHWDDAERIIDELVPR